MAAGAEGLSGAVRGADCKRDVTDWEVRRTLATAYTTAFTV